MNSIYNRIKTLLEREITVWMITDDEEWKVTIVSVREESGKHFCTDDKGKERELIDDEQRYETVNYAAPLFH